MIESDMKPMRSERAGCQCEETSIIIRITRQSTVLDAVPSRYVFLCNLS